MEETGSITIPVSYWPSMRALAFIAPGPPTTVKKLLWLLWFLLTVGLVVQHQSWSEVLYSPAILLIALTWRWWFRLPLFLLLARWHCDPAFDRKVSLNVSVTGSKVVIGTAAESLLLKAPAFQLRDLGRDLVVFASAGYIPIIVIPKKVIPDEWASLLAAQMKETRPNT